MDARGLIPLFFFLSLSLSLQNEKTRRKRNIYTSPPPPPLLPPPPPPANVCRRFMIGQYVTVHGDVISHVNISVVHVEDGGEYRCTAANRMARVHHSARLNIYGLPHVRPMGNYAAVAGETTVIKCPVAGFPIASITWEKGQCPRSVLTFVSVERCKILKSFVYSKTSGGAFFV